MKVSRTSAIQQVEPAKHRPERSQATAPVPGESPVTLSGSTAFVQKAREAAAAGTPFRSQVVEEVKASLEAGTFEQSIDVAETMDALLADL